MRTTFVTSITGRLSACAFASLLIGIDPAPAQVCAPVQECGDVDASGTVETSDALHVLRKSVGQPQDLTCECADGASVCGDGVVEGEEDCDVGKLNGGTCVSLGFAGGALDCSPGCTFETVGCYSARFVSTGYGVVVDKATGLIWERKVIPGGGASDPHDVDNEYTWSNTPGGTSPDGTLFTDFLASLNDNCTISGPEDSLAGSFGANCDWRIPTIPELRTILLASCPGDMNPCVDPTFGPIDVGKPYWSSMTIGATPTSALVTGFGDGAKGELPKSYAAHALAVRGVARLGGLKGVGEFPCPEVGCHGNAICIDPSGSGSGHCVALCDHIGIQGTCRPGQLCSDVDPGTEVVGACLP